MLPFAKQQFWKKYEEVIFMADEWEDWEGDDEFEDSDAGESDKGDDDYNVSDVDEE